MGRRIVREPPPNVLNVILVVQALVPNPSSAQP